MVVLVLSPLYNRLAIKSFVKVAELRQQINSNGPVNYWDFKSRGIKLEISAVLVWKYQPQALGWKYQYDQWRHTGSIMCSPTEYQKTADWGSSIDSANISTFHFSSQEEKDTLGLQMTAGELLIIMLFWQLSQETISQDWLGQEISLKLYSSSLWSRQKVWATCKQDKFFMKIFLPVLLQREERRTSWDFLFDDNLADATGSWRRVL